MTRRRTAPPVRRRRSTSRRCARTSRCCTRTVNGRPIVYLDSASSALQPQSVISAMTRYYETTHANVHRGVYATAEEATALYERARVVAGPLHRARRTRRTRSSSPRTRPSRSTWWRSRGAGPTCGPGDAVLLTEMEHHANIVPVDDPVRGARRSRPALHPDRRRRPPGPRRPRPRWSTGSSSSACRRMSNVLGHHPPGARTSPTAAHARGRRGGGRRRAAGPARAGRRARASASTSSPSRPTR